MVWLLAHTAKYPKYERFRLAKELETAIFNFHRCLLHATKVADRSQFLKKADIHLLELRTYMRIANSLKYTSDDQYGFFAESCTEIGKLLGGWLKS